MNRRQKEETVSSLQSALTDSQGSFLVEYKGLSVAELMNLRTSLRSQGGRFKVAKVTLMRRALQALPEDVQEGIAPHLKEQVGLVFAKDESPAIAKTLKEFAKEHAFLKLQVGLLEQKVLDKASVEALASLPSREVLLGQLCGTLQAPVSSFARVLTMVPTKLVLVLKAIEQQKAAS